MEDPNAIAAAQAMTASCFMVLSRSGAAGRRAFSAP
jgi:hypothetical protein